MTRKYVLKIVDDLEKLQKRSDEINLDDANEMQKASSIVSDLKDTLRANKDLIALSAPQLGYSDRIFCIKFANGDIRTFINPLIFANKELHLSRETQIGLNSQEYIVPRSTEIHAAYQTPLGKKEVNAFKGVVGEVFQQMVNLLDGVLLSDFGLIVLDGFDDLSEDERKEIISMYLDNLKETQKSLETQIENDPKLKSMDDAINFMTKIELGQIETMPLSEEEQKDYIKALKNRDTKE